MEAYKLGDNFGDGKNSGAVQDDLTWQKLPKTKYVRKYIICY